MEKKPQIHKIRECGNHTDWIGEILENHQTTSVTTRQIHLRNGIKLMTFGGSNVN